MAEYDTGYSTGEAIYIDNHLVDSASSEFSAKDMLELLDDYHLLSYEEIILHEKDLTGEREPPDSLVRSKNVKKIK